MFIPGLRVNAVARISNARKAIRSSCVAVVYTRDTVSPGRIIIVLFIYFFFVCWNEASRTRWTDKL